jgi:molecular chaperone GrpE
MKKKIAIPSEEEVARFGGGSQPESAGGPQAAQPSQESATPPADQSPPGAATPAEEAPASPETLRAELELWKDKCLRAKAEMANYQRRVEKERSDSVRYAHATFATALLPVLDDLERLMTAATEHKNDPDALADGVRLTLDGFLKVLKEFRVERIEAAGKTFDPSQHEAIMQQPSAEHAEPTVLTETSKGYRLHDRILRPARVIVSKPADPPAAAGGSEGGEPRE